MADLSNLLQECEGLVEQFEYEKALLVCRKILKVDSANFDARFMRANILVETDKVEEAKECLLELVEPSQNHPTHHEIILLLAQISFGQDALAYYSMALEKIEMNEDLESLEISILCSMAELYMTDLCMEEGAEDNCEELIGKAISLDPTNYEALQTLANLQLSQNKQVEAKESLLKSISSWHIDLPPFEFRLTCSRMLIELGCFELVQNILMAMIEEDDEILEIWYLLALSKFELGSFEESLEALESFDTLASTNTADVGDDILDAVAELREHLQEKLPEAE